MSGRPARGGPMVRIFTLAVVVAVCAYGRADEALRRTSVFVEGEGFVPTGPEWVTGEGTANQ